VKYWFWRSVYWTRDTTSKLYYRVFVCSWRRHRPKMDNNWRCIYCGSNRAAKLGKGIR